MGGARRLCALKGRPHCLPLKFLKEKGGGADGRLAQLVGCGADNTKVTGSIPVRATMSCTLLKKTKRKEIVGKQ